SERARLGGARQLFTTELGERRHAALARADQDAALPHLHEQEALAAAERTQLEDVDRAASARRRAEAPEHERQREQRRAHAQRRARDRGGIERGGPRRRLAPPWVRGRRVPPRGRRPAPPPRAPPAP